MEILSQNWDLRPATLLKKRLWHKRFSVIFEKSFNNTFFKEHLRATASEHGFEVTNI